MKNSAQHQSWTLKLNSQPVTAVLTIATLFAMVALITQSAQAQTFSVLYTFTGGSDGASPYAGVTLDRAANLYGTATLGGSQNCYFGGDSGCGTVFKLSHKGTGWIFSLLYGFTGGSDGWWPFTSVTLGPDGNVYGTTSYGGGTGCIDGNGCGTVFKLKPPPNFCRSVSCPWTKTELYQFTGGLDGGFPEGSLTFDPSGNIFGTTSYAQDNKYYGSVYELAPSNGGWTPSVLYTFTDYYQGGGAGGGVVFDKYGNLWGTTELGGSRNCYTGSGDPCGLIFELTPSGSGWSYKTVYEFDSSVGGSPTGNLIFDESGNLYGTLAINGPYGDGGVYQFNPSTGVLTVLYSFAGNGEAAGGPQGGVVMDKAGNLYGVDPYMGTHGVGFVFELSPSTGRWIYTDLHDFTGGSDGASPYGTLALDANGNLYGTNAGGVVFEITP